MIGRWVTNFIARNRVNITVADWKGKQVNVAYRGFESDAMVSRREREYNGASD